MILGQLTLTSVSWCYKGLGCCPPTGLGIAFHLKEPLHVIRNLSSLPQGGTMPSKLEVLPLCMVCVCCQFSIKPYHTTNHMLPTECSNTQVKNGVQPIFSPLLEPSWHIFCVKGPENQCIMLWISTRIFATSLKLL